MIFFSLRGLGMFFLFKKTNFSQLAVLATLGLATNFCAKESKNQVQFVGRNPEGASDEYTAPPEDYNPENGYKGSAGGDEGGVGSDPDGDGGGDSDGVDTDVPLDRVENGFRSTENPEDCLLNSSSDQFVEFPWPDDILTCYQSGKLYNFATKKCAVAASMQSFPIAEADSSVKAVMATNQQTTLGCNWDDALTVQSVFMDPKGQMSHIGVAEKNDKAKIVGCSEIDGDRYYQIIIQYWYPTDIDVKACKVADNWRIYTSCRQKYKAGITKGLSWEACLDYTGD